MRCALIIALCAGCGRSSLPDLASPVDSTPTLCDLGAGSWSWTTPELLLDVDALFAPLRIDANDDYWDPILTEDGLTLFLSTDLLGPWDVYALTRPSLTTSFDHVELLGPDVNVTGVHNFGYQPLDSVGVALAYGNFPLDGIAAGTPVVVLADIAVTPKVWRGLAIDAEQANLGDPRLTGDGAALVVAAEVDDTGLRQIFLSHRMPDGDFGAGTLVEGLTDADDSAPWMSTDQRVLFFAHTTDQTQAASDIWVATRHDPEAPFETAEPVAALNSEFFDGEPYFYEGGGACELYIVSQRPPGPGFKVFRSRLLSL